MTEVIKSSVLSTTCLQLIVKLAQVGSRFLGKHAMNQNVIRVEEAWLEYQQKLFSFIRSKVKTPDDQAVFNNRKFKLTTDKYNLKRLVKPRATLSKCGSG